jgi:UDP-glucose 4-epimerase
MRILLTGALGLIGRGVQRVIKEKKEGVAVRALDIRDEDIPSDVEFLHGDVCDPALIDTAVRGCDAVMHLAGHLGVANTEEDPLTCLEVNVIAVRAILDACRRHKIGRIVIASSSEVYGDAGGRLAEITVPRPKSVYAAAKLTAEKYALAYRQSYGLQAYVVRFFNVYGPGQRGDFVVSRFIANLRRGKAPRVYGDGSQVRSFCHVDDAALGALTLLMKENVPEHVFNVGNDSEPITISDLARRTLALSGLQVEPEYVPFEHSDRSAAREISTRVPDLKRAESLLDYRPQIGLDAGLSDLLLSSTLHSRTLSMNERQIQRPRTIFQSSVA